jgi:CSLREA domain-containing protein
MHKTVAAQVALAWLCGVLGAAVWATPALADRTWDRGAGTNFWTDAANWNSDGLPTSADSAVFTDTGPGTVDLSGTSQPASGSLLGLTFNNATSGYTVQNGGTIFTNGVTNSSGAAVTSTVSARLFTNNVTVNSGTLVLSNTTNTINGPNSIAAGAKLDLTAPSSNSIGSVSLNGGTLLLRGDGNLSGSALTITAANSVLDFQPGSGSSGAVNGITFNAGTSLTLQGSAGTTATLGNLSGTGTAALSNSIAASAGTFSGFTTFTKSGAGRLAVSGSSPAFAGTVSVTDGTLGGTGTLGGPLTVSGPLNSGGAVAPGNSVGTLSSGDFSITSAGGTLGIELDPTNSGGLGTSDNLDVTGTVTLTGGNLALSLLSAPTVGQTFRIITNDGSDAVTGTFSTANGAPIAGNSFGVGSTSFQISYAGGSGNDVVLTVTSTPGLVVTTTADTVAADGQTSLREALAYAATLSGAQTITIQAGLGTITLSSELPAIQKDLTIYGNNNTLSGNNLYRGFFIGAWTPGTATQVAVTVVIQDLTITNAKALGGTGGPGSKAGGGGAGLGGAIFIVNLANVTLGNVTLSTNNAAGGTGGSGLVNGSDGGGGGMGGGGGNGDAGTAGGGGLGRGANGGGNGSAGGPGIATAAAPGGAGANSGAGAGGINGGGGGGGAPSNGSGGGGGVGGGGGTNSTGGAGGFGGGGGGQRFGSGSAGPGGFGGGGGSAVTGFSGGQGGFGGGGGAGGNSGPGGFGGGAGVGAGSGGGGGGGGGAGMGGALFVQQGGSLTLDGPLTVNGNTVTAGSGASGSGNGSAFGSGVFLQGNGTIAFTPGSGQTQTVADVIADQTGSGGTAGNAGTYALTKSGAGTLALNATNTYTGPTSISSGTLSGTGSVSGPLSVASGGTMAPGNSVGTFSSGNFSVTGAGGTLAIELDPTNSGGNGITDNLNVTGTVTLTGGDLVPTLLSAPTMGQTFKIITNDGTADAVTGTFSTANGTPIAGNSFSVSGCGFSINYAGGDGNDVVLTVVALPSLVVTVIEDTDDGNYAANDISLREAINFANGDADQSIITFDPTVFATKKTITLNGTQLPNITTDITIEGPNASGAGVTVDGGGKSRVFRVDGGTGTISNLTLTGGTASPGAGGGSYSDDGNGGAISVRPGSALTLNNCTVTGNSSVGGNGAGITNSGALTLNNCTVADNTTSLFGGGINNSGTMTLNSCTVAGNTAETGGGILSQGTLNIGNTIVADNTAATGPDVNGTVSSQGYNLIGKTDGSTGWVASDKTGTSASPLDAKLGSLADNGGPTKTHALLAGSVAVNAIQASNEVQRITPGGTSGGTFRLTFKGETTNPLTYTLGSSPSIAQVRAELEALPTVGVGNVQVTGSNGNFFDITFQGALAGANQPQITAGSFTGGTTCSTSTLSEGVGAPATDQRGVARPQGLRADIGAFEFNSFSDSLIVTTTDDEENGTSDPRFGSGTSLREAIIYANSSADTSTITFDIGGAESHTINLAGVLPGLSTNINIDNDDPGAKPVTVRRSTAGGTPNFRIFTVNSGKTITLSGLTISNGKTANGGGIFNSGTLTVSNSTLSGNSAPGDEGGGGGGIFNNVGTLTVSNSTFSGNSGSSGGGIYNSGGTVIISNSTFSSNTSNGGGGGVRNVGSTGTATITNSTFSGNSAGSGGGINTSSSGTVNIGNTILKKGASGPNIVNSFGTVNSQGYNLSDDAAGGDASTAPGGLLNGTGDIRNTDPKLGDLAGNGGPTFTHLPAGDSPAINKGDPNFDTTNLPFDQRGTGFPRVQSARLDIGAVEVTNSAPVVSDIAITPDEDTTYTFAAADFDGGFADTNPDPVQKIKITSLPTHGTLKINGLAAQVGDEIARDDIDTLTYKPSLNYHATDSFGWNGSDGTVYGATAAKVNITVDEVNDDPVFDPTSLEISGNEGQLITFFAPGSDVDTGTVLEYSLVGAPAGATINSATGEFKWTPSEAQGPGDYTFQIKVIDGEGGEAFLGVTLHVAEANAPPVLPAISGKSVNEGSNLAFTLAAASDSDIPANTLTYSASGLPTGATFNTSTRAFSWTPTELQGPDAYPITFKVSDGKGGEASRSVVITVNEVNQPPVVSLGANRSVVGGVPFSFGFSASDPDRPFTGLAFNLANSPSWVGLTNAPAFYGTAPVSLSTYSTNVTVVANDTAGAKAQSSLTLTVTPPPVAWFVTPTWSSTEGTLTYVLKNNKTQAISGIWVSGKLPVVLKSVAKSVGTVSTQAQSGGGTGITWNGFNLAAGQQATLTLKVARPGKGVQVAYALYCAFGPGTNATLTTNDVFAP